MLDICLFNENVKYAIRLEIPTLFKKIYYLINVQEQLKQFILKNIIENYKMKLEADKYKDM